MSLKYKKLGDHGAWNESIVRVLEEIIRGNDTWTKLNVALEGEISFGMVSRNLYDPKYGLFSRRIIRKENERLKVNYSDLESLVRLLDLLLKDPGYYDLFTNWLYEVYSSDYGDLSILLEAFSQEGDFDKWETVMKRSRGAYDLEFAVSYMALTMFYATQVWEFETNRETGSFVGYNLAIDTVENIKESARHKAVKPILKRIYQNLKNRKEKISLDPEIESEYAGISKVSVIGEIGTIIKALMFAEISKVSKAKEKIELILEEGGINLY